MKLINGWCIDRIPPLAQTRVNAKAFNWRAYLAPRYWLLWLVFGVLRLTVLLPLPILEKLGGFIGWLIYRLAPSRRQVARINIQQAYPGYTETQIKQLVKLSFNNTGMSLFEMALAWWARRDYLQSHCEIDGMQHLQDALAKGRGVILLTGHFTTLEIGGILMALYTPLEAVYKRAHNPMFNTFMHHYRSKHLQRAIPNTNARAFIQALKSNVTVWYAPDQDFSAQDVVFTPFLGGMASTLMSTVRMAEMTGAAVVPYYPQRLPGAKGYKLVIQPALENFPAGNHDEQARYANAARINQAIDAMVRSNPEQYAWIHKRFKTQPEGAKSIY